MGRGGWELEWVGVGFRVGVGLSMMGWMFGSDDGVEQYSVSCFRRVRILTVYGVLCSSLMRRG